MAVINEGNGVSYTYSGITLDPISMQLAGFNRENIDLTTLSNTAVKTSVTSILAEYQPFTVVTEMDPAEYDGFSAGGEGGSFKVTFADGSSLTLYANVLSTAPVEIANATRPTYEFTFQPTNLNSGVETAPAYAVAP